MADSLLSISIEGLSFLTYVNYQAEMEIKRVSSSSRQNAFSFLRSVTIENKSLTDYRDVDLHIRTPFAGIEVAPVKISLLEHGKKTLINQFSLFVDAMELYKVNEAMPIAMTFELVDAEGNILAKQFHNLKLLPIDESASDCRIPEILASFVTPNDDEVKKLVEEAAGELRQKYGRDSFAGYQYHDPNKVLEELDALYRTLLKRGIRYSAPPTSFEKTFQRVRLPYVVLKEKVATCLDFALLFASLAESIGLKPLVISLRSHALVGVWLDDEHSVAPFEENGTLLATAASKGFNYLSLIDVTMAHSSVLAPFDQAVDAGYKSIAVESRFRYALDIDMCRKGHMLPVPTPHDIDGESKLELPDFEIEDDYGTPRVELSARRYIPTDDRGNKSRFDHWLEKLLDLNLANRLINLKIASSASQFLVPDAEELVRFLSERNRLHVVPFDFNSYPFNDNDKILDFPPKTFSKLAEENFKKGQILATSRKGDVESYFKGLSRKSNTALEESGSNPLFLTIGLFKWFDNEKAASIGKGAMYAPVFLLPVKMPRRKSGNYFSLEYDFEDLSLNTTVLEYFHEVYNLDFDPILGSMRKREDGIPDIRMIYNFIRTKISEKNGWGLLESYSSAGLFGFAHFVMWNDLKYRKDELLENPFIASFVSGEKKWQEKEGLIEAHDIDGMIAPEDLALPLPCDSSQIKAISDALNGESFIMDGPPGTGKSQTIANMIVNFLFHRKSVLFVAEKEVALGVVKSRLDALGLGQFCLQLSSVKTNKSDVLKNIGTLLDMGPLKGGEGYKQKADEVAQSRARLNGLLGILELPEGFFCSINQAVLAYLRSKKAKGLFEVDEDYARGLTAEKYRETLDAIDSVLNHSSVNRGYSNNPFRPYQKREYSLLEREALPQALKPLLELDKNLSLCLYNCLRKLPGLQSTRKNAEIFVELSSVLGSSKGILYDKIGSEIFLDAEDILKRFLDLNQEITRLENEIKLRFDPSVLSLHLHKIKDLKESYAAASLFARRRYYKRLYKEFKPYIVRGRVSRRTILKTVEDLRYIEEKTKLIEALGSYPRYVYPHLPDEASSYDILKEDLDLTLRAGKLIRDMDVSSSVDYEKICNIIAKAEGDMTKIYEDNDVSLRRRISERSFIRDKLFREHGFDLDLYPDCPEYFKSEAQKVSFVISNDGRLGAWVKFLEAIDRLKAVAPNGLVEGFMSGRLSESLIKDAYVNAVAYKVVAFAASDKGVANLSGSEVMNAIEDYGRQIDELSRLSVLETAAIISESYPLITEGIANSTEVYQLKKLSKNGGRGVSLRFLFNTYGKLIHNLCPCFLMSPQSVAQFLSKDDHFDVVIFDEASQIPTSEAIGAISRGDSLVIAGDQQQMPPSNYFNANISGVNEGENTLLSLEEDLESLLDDAIVLGFKRNRLTWHYRSRHESLIAFSNNQFYDNELFTFPSPNEEKQCVSYIHVKGDYERGRGINRAEARAVVDEVVRRLKDPSKREHSIGVVTFNEAQQNLIMDLLEKEEAKLKATDINPGGESIFVKNLENVQGDERDVILFSTTYGPDKKTGTLSLNFGPLSREKGERRLNVAVTRAREEMMVFSSILPSDIKAERAKNEGARYLKDFLRFSMEGTETLSNMQGGAIYHNPDSVARYLAEDLRKLGYEVVTDLGTSVFRLDLAIVDPDNKDRFILGILLDGPSYIKAKTARDRNLVQPSVLRNLNWRLHRVWSLEYFDHPEQVVANIVEKINSKDSLEPDDDHKLGPLSFSRKEIELFPHALPYLRANLSIPSSDNESVRIFEAIRRLIETEGPISKSEIMDRIRIALGKSRLGNVLRSNVEIDLSDTPKETEICAGEQFYYPSGTDIEGWSYYRIDKENPRNILTISFKEFSNAFYDILKAQGAMSEEDLIRQAAKLFGEDTLTEKRRKYIKSAIKYDLDNRHLLYKDEQGFVYLR